mmetsp:Transcript_75909/g.180417  ORF Transcript_75909/g.180417 Transcript_75909/m.180417 type:complete len:336 (+) Transcript_75909:72-1079(+)
MASLDDTVPVSAIPKVAEPAPAPPAQTSAGGPAASRPAMDVATMRDRLLREAQQEQLRVSQRLEGSTGADPGSPPQQEDRGGLRPLLASRKPTVEATSQTEPVPIRSQQLELESEGPLAWGPSDDASQAEAISSIQRMVQSRGQAGDLEQRISHLEEQIQAERSSQQELQMMLVQERGKREAVQGQVLTLEAEMDAKESSLQLAQDKLERRNADLVQVQKELHTMQAIGEFGAFGGSPSQRHAGARDFRGGQPAFQQVNSVEAGLENLRLQMREQDGELEQKDQQINALLAQLRQQNSYARGPDEGNLFLDGAGGRFQGFSNSAGMSPGGYPRLS